MPLNNASLGNDIKDALVAAGGDPVKSLPLAMGIANAVIKALKQDAIVSIPTTGGAGSPSAGVIL